MMPPGTQKSLDNVGAFLYNFNVLLMYVKQNIRDLSSAGRASALQAEGHRFEPYRSHMARWLNWLERPVHTREVESSSLSLAIVTNIVNIRESP